MAISWAGQPWVNSTVNEGVKERAREGRLTKSLFSVYKLLLALCFSFFYTGQKQENHCLPGCQVSRCILELGLGTHPANLAHGFQPHLSVVCTVWFSGCLLDWNFLLLPWLVLDDPFFTYPRLGGRLCFFSSCRSVSIKNYYPKPLSCAIFGSACVKALSTQSPILTWS